LRHPPLILAQFQVGIYLCCLLYAGRTSVISFGDLRMLYPVFPMALLVFGSAVSTLPVWQSVGRGYRAGYTLLVGGVVCYGLLHCQGILQPLPAAPYAEQIRSAVEGPIGHTNSLKEWIDHHVPPRRPIVAGDGQACGYLMKREAISLVSRDFSKFPWTAERLREVATRYRANILVLFRDGTDTRYCASESPFLADLLRGKSPPWVVPAAQNSKVLVYRLVVDGGRAGEDPGGVPASLFSASWWGPPAPRASAGPRPPRGW
jgi:hypothetical protein